MRRNTVAVSNMMHPREWLARHRADADADLVRSMLQSFVETLMSAERLGEQSGRAVRRRLGRDVHELHSDVVGNPAVGAGREVWARAELDLSGAVAGDLH
ncbi:MAG: hypothetical protein QOI44_491 [Actinomycetota bacterium]|nr:hypothetical protein [Actinomycetota bacterium]